MSLGGSKNKNKDKVEDKNKYENVGSSKSGIDIKLKGGKKTHVDANWGKNNEKNNDKNVGSF